MSQCEECRSKAYFKKRYPVACSTCGQHRALDVNGACRPCNTMQGLRQCKDCGELLAISLDFYSTKRRCRKCLSLRRGLGSRGLSEGLR